MLCGVMEEEIYLLKRYDWSITIKMPWDKRYGIISSRRFHPWLE